MPRAAARRPSSSPDDAGDQSGGGVRAPEARFHVDRAAAGARRRAAGHLADGNQIAFAAVGDIYVMPVGGKPVNITKDAALAPIRRVADGTQLAYRPTRTASTSSSGSATWKTGQSPAVTN